MRVATETLQVLSVIDAPPCDLCRSEHPCECAPYILARCLCTCGRCQYPYPLPDDGPVPTKGKG